MKNWLSIFTVFAILLTTSCEKDDNSDSVGGSTDLSANAVGYKYTGTLKIGGSFVATDAKAVVVKNDGKIIDVQATLTLPTKLKNMIASPYANASGIVDLTGKFINSTDGVAYVNASGVQSVLVKYDAKVGDQWTYTTKGGKSLTRKVTAVSSTDDFFWGGMLIKVITVEQNLPYPGFTKAIYKANHKFGLVYVEILLEDGTSMSMSF